MFRYIIKRIIQMIPLLIIISIIAFSIIRIAEIYASANPLAQLKMNPTVTKQTIEREELRLGLTYIREDKVKLISSEYKPTSFNGLFEVKMMPKSFEISLAGGEPFKEIFFEPDKNESITPEQLDKINDSKLSESINNLKSGEFLLSEEANTLYFSEEDAGNALIVKYKSPSHYIRRYFNWAKKFVVGDMGESYYYKSPVKSLIIERIANTLTLGLTTITFTWLVAIPLGIFLAVRQYSLVDQVLSSLSYFFMGFPDFFLAILFLLFAANTGLFPISGMTSTDNNHMAKVKSIYAGKYEHSPNAKLSEEHKKYDLEIRNKAEKDQIVSSLKNELNLDLEYSKDKISSSAGLLFSQLPKLDRFPQDLARKVQDEYSTQKYISYELGLQVYKSLKKINYYTFSDQVAYSFKHIGRIFYHYSKHIPDVLYHLVLPAITLSIISIASLQRRMRANLLDVLNEEYITTARAKGLPENVVIYKHAVRNALNPMITLLGFEFAHLLSGAAFVEILFTWPGLGNMMLEAVLGSDLSLVMAGLIMSSVMLLIGNLLADLLLGLTDPRIKLEA
jgi:ABC-type dipeptide/oligopeptide/nickel transport system permease component